MAFFTVSQDCRAGDGSLKSGNLVVHGPLESEIPNPKFRNRHWVFDFCSGVVTTMGCLVTSASRNGEFSQLW